MVGVGVFGLAELGQQVQVVVEGLRLLMGPFVDASADATSNPRNLDRS